MAAIDFITSVKEDLNDLNSEIFELRSLAMGTLSILSDEETIGSYDNIGCAADILRRIISDANRLASKADEAAIKLLHREPVTIAY